LEYFLPQGTVLWTRWNNGQTETDLDRTGHEMDIPLVVLVDDYSASGSEVLAAVLQQHYPNALIVGLPTAGAVNIGRTFSVKDITIMVTCWELRVNGQRLEDRGVQPDVLVYKDFFKDAQFLRAREELVKLVEENKLTVKPAE
jgi:carboxyl-terminal processing protease